MSDLSDAVAAFRAAKAAIHATFGGTDATAIVRSVRQGDRPRNGHCANGWEYFVHGIGYTVVLPGGRQAHIDASKDGDVFTRYDIAFFAERDVDPAELAALAASGTLRAAPGHRYFVDA